MSYQPDSKSTPARDRLLNDVLRWARNLGADWAANDGPVWVYLSKAAIAALMALGIAMLLELPSPRTAMVTVFVLMRPMNGLVLAKSFYRVLGTAAGVVASVVFGGLFSQQPELYIAAITLWCAVCTALAVRFRHFRWYAFVLAGYTAVIIGVPVVNNPNGLFLAALTRAAEISVGILCSAVVSALVFPVSSSAALLRSLRQRQMDLIALCADVLARRCDSSTFERRFAMIAGGIAEFDAERTFAAFDDFNIRARRRRLAHVDSEYTSICTRLHMLAQLMNRRDDPCSSQRVLSAFAESAGLLDGLHACMLRDGAPASAAIAQLDLLQASLPSHIEARRRDLGCILTNEARIEAEAVTASLQRLLADLVSYLDDDESFAEHRHHAERSTTQYETNTSVYVVALTFVRTALAVGSTGAFWLVSAWPSGGFAVITAAIVAGLTSAAPRPVRLTLQIMVGAACAIAVGYAYLCYVYPNIDGFPLLCAAIAPIALLSAFLVDRPELSGFGVGLSVFFCLLAGPDNSEVYAPQVLLNNGVAVMVGVLASFVVAAVVFPLQAPWVLERIGRDLRREISIACFDTREGVAQRFHSRIHDLLSQLRMLLTPGTRLYADAWYWTLATLETGQAIIDLRVDVLEEQEARLAADTGWIKPFELVKARVADFFDQPDEARLRFALRSIERAERRICYDFEHAQSPDRRARMERVAGHLNGLVAILSRVKV